MTKLKHLKAKTEKHPRYKVPRRVFDIQQKASKGNPKAIAKRILKKLAPDFQIQSDLSQLKFDKVKESILGHHVLFQQYHEKKPISGAWVRVDIDKTGKVYNIQNDLIPAKVIRLRTAKPKTKDGSKVSQSRVTSTQAKVIALQEISDSSKVSKTAAKPEFVYLPVKGTPTRAWKVVVRSSRPTRELKVYVDEASGKILGRVNLLKERNGKGKVFIPNPIAALNDTTLEDISNIPEPAYSEVTLANLRNTGHLDGKFVSTQKTSNRVKRLNFDFRFNRNHRAFKEVMVYYHIDQVQRYIQELGFDNVLNKAIKVDVDGISDDNSFYSPTTKSLTFGRGGVADAEDAEIILHEYGHAIQDNQIPGFGPSGEARAMGEGFGDYLAASFFADMKPGRLRTCVGSWDAVAYSGDEPPCLRRVDSNKKYPRDIVGDEHTDGEIWSSSLWEIRGILGGRITDRLVLAHHFLLTRDSSFENSANMLITVDHQLNQGRNEETIRNIFVRRGILPNAKRKNRRAGIPFSET